MTGSVLDLNSASGYSNSVRENLTIAEVKAISEAILTPTTTTTSQQPTTTTTTMQPTLVALIDFNADPGNNTVTLIWHTASELINSGFNLHRSEVPDGAYQKINNALILAQGSVTQGASYEFIDTNVQNRKTNYFKLKDIDLNGNSTMHGPVSAMPRWIFGIFRK
jgi:hypothetical protein